MARKRDVLVRVGADVAEFDKKMAASAAQLDKLAAIGKKAGAVIATSVAAAAAAVAALTLRGIALGDALDDAANALGVTVDELASLRYVAKFANVEAEQLDASLAKLARTVGMAADGNKAAAASLEQIGLKGEDLRGLSLDEQFLAVADAVSTVENATDRARIAQDIFGRSGAKLLPLLNQGSAAIAAQREEAAKLGLTLDEVQRKNIVEASDAMDRLKAAGDGVALQLAGAFGPAIEGVADAIVWLTQKVIESLPRLQALAERFLGIQMAADNLSDMALQESLVEQIKAMDDLNDRIADQQELLRMAPGPGNEVRMNELLADQVELQARINELLAERVQRKQERELPDKPASTDEDDETFAARQKALEDEIALEVMLFETFKGIEEQKTALRETEFEQMWSNLQAELEVLAQLDEARSASTAAWIDNLLIEVAELDKAEKAKQAMREFGHKHFLSKLVSGSAAFASASEKLFKLNQAAAVAQTTVDGIASAKAAFKNAGGYPWGIPAAAADAFDTVARIAAIKNTALNGGGAGFTTPSAAGTPVVGGAPVPQAAGPAVYLQMNGEFFSGEAVRGVIDRINDAIRDGGKVIMQ